MENCTFRMYDLTSGNLNPIVNYDQGITKNVMAVGCQVLIITGSGVTLYILN